jgi:hypothetical protein
VFTSGYRGVTEPEALDDLPKLSHEYHSLTVRFNVGDRFHAKFIYLRRPAQAYCLFVGSSNISVAGLAGLGELNVQIWAHPQIPSGIIGRDTRPVRCSADEFDVEFLGKASHGPRLHEGVDVITVPASPRAAARADLPSALASGHGARATVEIRRGEPVLVNDAGMVRLVAEAAADVTGPDAILAIEPWTSSDDFAFRRGRAGAGRRDDRPSRAALSDRTVTRRP